MTELVLAVFEPGLFEQRSGADGARWRAASARHRRGGVSAGMPFVRSSSRVSHTPRVALQTCVLPQT